MAESKVLSREHEPSFGKFIWAQEGTEGGKWHSRRPHVPGDKSGVTIGRGYDMKSKSASEVEADLTSIGVKPEYIEKLKQCVGTENVGIKARQKIEELGLKDVDVLEPAQQLELFKISFSKESQEAARVCSKPEVIEVYGDCGWPTMNPYLKEFIIDLKYQGLYTQKTTMKFLQEAIVNRNYEELKRMVKEKLPKRFLQRNLKRIKLLEEGERQDRINRQLSKPLANNFQQLS